MAIVANGTGKRLKRRKAQGYVRASARARMLAAKAARAANQNDVTIRIALSDGDAPKIVRFGSVEVSNNAPGRHVIEANIKAGADALRRAKDVFTTPGVQLIARAGVPRFRVDPAEPRVIIRELDGRTERGRIVHGSFVPTHE